MSDSLEIWKPVVGYENLYEISNFGNVRSLFRYKKILKWNIVSSGYASVQLFKNKAGTGFLVHRLVATAFIREPRDNEQVNHIDENKLNNNVENLEWVSPLENMRYGTRTERQKKNTDYTTEQRKNIARSNGEKVCKAVSQFTKDGVYIKTYKSAKEAHKETGLNHSHILECCMGKRYKTVGGYIWKYERRDDLLAFLF